MPKVLGFSESQYDRLAAMLRAYESGTLWPSDKARNPPLSNNPAKVRFHNDSGEEIPAWGVMRITGIQSGNDAWRLKVGKPNTTISSFYLVNSATACPASTDGWGTYLWNSGHVLYDTSVTPAIGEEWGPQDGTWTIRKNHWGFRIIGGTTGSGAVSRVVAAQYMVHELIGKADSSIAKASSGTVSVWRRNETTDAWEDSTMNITATALGAAITASKYASMGWRNGLWLIACWET